MASADFDVASPTVQSSEDPAVSTVASECWGGSGDGTFTFEHVTDFQIEVFIDAET